MLWLSGVLLFPPAPFPWYTLNACHNYMYSKQTAVAADLGPANTKTFLNFSKVGISVVSAARGKYWHKWIWTLQSFLYSGFIVPWKQMKSIEKSENMTGRGKKQNERTMPLARKWELTKIMIYVAFYFHVQWFITIMKLCQLIDFHKQTTVLQEGWLFI